MAVQRTSQILIVDDTEVNRMILHSLLGSYGIASDMAESGQECLQLCSRKRYDLILMDHRMPDMDGVDTLVALRELFQSEGYETPVICHTSEDVKSNRNLYRAAGFADVLMKPVDVGQLLELLKIYFPGEIFVDKKESDEQEKLQQELQRLPDWLSDIPEIDLASGIRHCRTADDLLDVLTVFAASIPEKAREIETFWEGRNREYYTLKVHSLKSMLRLIGANALADLAADLESAGKQGAEAVITEQTPKLLVGYRALLPMLERLIPGKSAETEPLREIDEDMLQDAYTAISEFASCYDVESIQMVLDSLAEYRLQGEDISKVAAISSALSHMDWEGIRMAMEK